MPEFHIGKYSYSASPNFYYIYSNKQAIKIYDRRLHKSLDKIFHERCYSSSSSSQFKKFHRDPQHDTDWESIINPILEQEPVLSECFSKEELGELTLLWISVLAGYEKSAELLVRSGANVSEPFGRREPQVIDEKWTVLHVLLQMAPFLENKILICLMIDHGANLQARDYREKTVLHYAVEKSLVPVPITQTLLEKGADANAADIEGITPLFIAVSKYNAKELVSLLIKHGADLQARDHMGRTVLYYAVKDKQVQMTAMLLDNGADVNAADDKGMTPLLFAASSRKANELVPLLMKHGADVCARSKRGENALHVLTRALECSHGLEPINVVELARFFIERSVSLDDKSKDDLHQPIHLAVHNRMNALIKLYLDNGANVNALTKHGYSPLYIAAQSDAYTSTLVVDMLLKRGANVNLRMSKGRTALHAACENLKSPFSRCLWRNDGSVIKLLLLAGADVLVEDDDGIAPIACMILEDNMKNPSTKLMIRLLALKKARQPSIKLQEERFVERHPMLQNYYHDCFEEIDKMKITRFIHTCTFFELLTKSHWQIGALMRNPNFETAFKQCDLSGFLTYAEDILEAFKRAQNLYLLMLEQESVINEAFYDMLPYIVVRRIVRYISEDC